MFNGIRSFAAAENAHQSSSYATAFFFIEQALGLVLIGLRADGFHSFDANYLAFICQAWIGLVLLVRKFDNALLEAWALGFAIGWIALCGIFGHVNFGPKDTGARKALNIFACMGMLIISSGGYAWAKGIK